MPASARLRKPASRRGEQRLQQLYLGFVQVVVLDHVGKQVRPFDRDLIGGEQCFDCQELLEAIDYCHLHGAKLYLKRAFFTQNTDLPTATVVGAISLFGGDVEIKSSGGIKLDLTVKSKTQGLSQEFPRRKYYPQGSYTTTEGTVTSTGTTNDTCLIAPFVPRKEVLL